MDSFEYNKLIGAFLGVVFVVFSVGIVSDTIFAAPHPEKEPLMLCQLVVLTPVRTLTTHHQRKCAAPTP